MADGVETPSCTCRTHQEFLAEVACQTRIDDFRRFTSADMSAKVKDYWNLVGVIIKLTKLTKQDMKEILKKIWATLYNRLITNWRTTIAGILTAVLGWLLYDGVITSDVFGVLVMILGFFGIPIKDPRADKTNKKQ